MDNIFHLPYYYYGGIYTDQYTNINKNIIDRIFKKSLKHNSCIYYAPHISNAPCRFCGFDEETYVISRN